MLFGILDSVTTRWLATRHQEAGQGGHLLWIELARGTDTMELSRRALARRVGIVPGRLFSTGETYGHCFRLNCGFPLRGGWEEALDTMVEKFRGILHESGTDRGE